jgi:hypothetical protein
MNTSTTAVSAGSLTYQPRRPRIPRIAGMLVAGAIALGGLVTMAPDALADEAAAPPATAVAAPGTSMTPATGDGNEYWASDLCHYFHQNGQWFSDLCWLQPVGANNEPVAQLALVPNIGAGASGPAPAELIRVDLSDPGYRSFNVPGNPLFAHVQWIRQPIGDPTAPAEAMVYDQVTGGYVWIGLSDLVQQVRAGQGARYGFVPPSSPAYVPVPANDPTVTAVLAESAAILGGKGMVSRPCEYSYNGC